MTTRRMFMMSGGSLVPLLVLALLVGNQWVVDAIDKSGFKLDEGLGPLVRHLFFVAWRFTPPRGLDWRFVVSDDLTTLVLFAVVALLVLAAARTVDPQRGPLSALITGWWAAVVAGGVAGGLSGLLLKWAVRYPGGSVSRNFFESLEAGAASGLLYGWLAGLGALAGFLLSRPRGQAAPRPAGQYAPQQPYGAPQSFAPQQGAPMQQPYAPQPYPSQQPYGQQPGVPPQGVQPGLPPGAPQPPLPAGNDQPGLPPQHPAAVPYVPPARPAQSPGWEGMPVPPQAGAAAPPSVPPAQSPAPAPEAAAEAAGAPSEPEAAGVSDGDEPEAHAPGDSGPQDAVPAGTAPESAAHDEDDDEEDDLADRTMVDRKPDLPRDPDPMPPPQ
ncbi:hypothetical protein F8568_026195 [Actinomadura sp. LD22]|uniref:Uncharacterized protein n=1 Tax=Actinomadura physcomitrii TaxID=2650748 RepID=A0A6I4MDN3_9ACTN|nr:hypothetical protein [Actinomadura physcomitrii]MWA03812.1 hypothetical protein [Actinomadura physcomitrii]